MRDDFTQSIRRSLAHRVNLLCSNPECRANTSGPQTDPDKAVNVGVAAHIRAASQGGPRFNQILSEKVRRSASNGIWLCQTCAKLVDSDEQKYTTLLLLTWKQSAEKEAESRIGKTNRHNNRQTSSKAEKELKRNHQIRDELTRALQLSVDQRRALPVNAPQYRKYSEGEFIVHRLGESCYPGSDNSSGISAWFKLEMFDFYFNGIEGILDIQYALVTEHTKSWSFLPEEKRADHFPPGFWEVKIFKTGKIPWRNIRHYDLSGDEYYRSPHLYCLYADNGMPYESFGYYIISESDTYHFSLPEEGCIPLEKLLGLDIAAINSWEFLKAD